MRGRDTICGLVRFTRLSLFEMHVRVYDFAWQHIQQVLQQGMRLLSRSR